jgi:hypothetical protein
MYYLCPEISDVVHLNLYVSRYILVFRYIRFYTNSHHLFLDGGNRFFFKK